MATLGTQADVAGYLLRRGDDALVLGQRLSEWTGHCPIIEEDLAMTNVALDLIGQAKMWLSAAGEAEGAGRDADRLAYFRTAREFRNVLLVELPNGDFGRSQLRQFFFDTRHFHLLGALGRSRDERVASIAQKAVREVAYHVRRSGEWVVRLGDGTAESREKMQTALDDLWPYTGELFRDDALDAAMHEAGIAPALASLREPWLAHVRGVLDDATLEIPADAWMHSGGTSGRHTEHLDYLLAEMQSLRRSVPGERW